ncbi:MAG: LysM peptidoglycan-binding domain-containing protein [Lysobacterales bacterium]
MGGVASTASSAPRALPSTYTVLQGDSLSKIAKRLYGKASAWRKLFDANRDQIEDADLIHPGQVLKVPLL